MRALRRWWWPIALIALIILFVKGWLLTGMVTGMAEDASVEALTGVGLENSVAFDGVDGATGFGPDGLNVTLSGPASAEQAAVAAVAARDEVDTVRYIVTEDDLATAAAGEEDEEPAPEPVVLDAAAITMAVGAGEVVVGGIVPDEATRDTLLAAAGDNFPGHIIHDEMTIEADTVTLDGGSVTITGEATSDEEKALWLGQVEAAAAGAGLSVVDQVSVMEAAEVVRQSLNDLFALEPIEFDVNQATIRPVSIPTLDAAAQMINDNPEAGRLLVVGHTDSDGSDAANQQLSEDRAAAVVAYLVDQGEVDPGRLDHEGRGESELLVDPESSAEDKQRNRRIAWEILE